MKRIIPCPGFDGDCPEAMTIYRRRFGVRWMLDHERTNATWHGRRRPGAVGRRRLAVAVGWDEIGAKPPPTPGSGATMKYLCLVYAEERPVRELSPGTVRA
jgi:hypothetical protein